uniref:Uncharacterized protein n=1 Tax=Hucho hucho TaxID=62062 RepID=A0A4W5JQ45_9TELE
MSGLLRCACVHVCVFGKHLRLSPVKLNMPICCVMWSQVPGVPRATSLAFNWSLINRTRSAMVFTFPFLQGEGGEERDVMATMRAPWEGGLDQVVLTIFSIWDRTRVRLSLSWATTRMAQASLSRLPDAKPW